MTLSGSDLTGPGGPPIATLRRGRPRYRVGYIAEVMQYIAAMQRRHKGRPVHIALSIACRDLRMSKRTWLRMVRTLEAAHWLRREAKPGGIGNKGAVYWLLDPPNGRHRLEYASPPPPPPVVVHDGERSRGVDTDAPIRNLIAETVISNTERPFSHSLLNVPETVGNRIPGTFPNGALKVPLIRIAERSLGERSRPTDGTSAAAAHIEEPSARPPANTMTPPAPGGTAANLPPNPSLTSQRSTGRGVPVRYGDGTETLIVKSTPDPEAKALIDTIVAGTTRRERARAYLEACARYEANLNKEAMPKAERTSGNQGEVAGRGEPPAASEEHSR